MEYKDLSNAVKSFDATSGTFEGWAAYYGNVDLGGDVIEPGSFTRSLRAHDGEVPLCWQHDLATPIGMGHLEDAERGLKIHGALNLHTEQGQRAHELMKPMEGFRRAPVRGLSIGYETVKAEYVPEKDGKQIRHIKEIKLFEVSAVTVGMNPRAVITGVKAQSSEYKALMELLRELTKDYSELKATLVDQGILNDSALSHSLQAIQDAGLGMVLGDSQNSDSENYPAEDDSHSLKELWDTILQLKGECNYDDRGKNPNHPGP